MAATLTDQNLLLGIIALQMDFISRDQLVAAMNAWALDKSRSLGQVLVQQGMLSQARCTLLESLVQEHVKQHGDTSRSLASLAPSARARVDLETIEDEELRDSLGQLPTALGVETTSGATTVGYVGQPTSEGGRFRIVRLHARGGLGEVFVARDEELRREVAVKRIRPEQSGNPQGRARFLLEAEITGSLEHPGIVPVYGLGMHDDGRPYYAMRLIRGQSLKDAILEFHREDGPVRSRAQKRLELRELLDRFIDVCDAIEYAHSRGVLHRDLKPLNVMLGPFGETLVVDWGLAKVTARPGETAPAGESHLAPESAQGVDATLDGQQIGTPAYMSPEAAEGRLELVGPASDVYSLGATLYAILTGRSPFADKDVPSMLQRVRQGRFPHPRGIHAWIDVALEAICLKAMSLRPQDRYSSPRGLAEDLTRWMADEPVSAWKESPLRQLSRWTRRHQSVMAAATVATLFAAIAISYGYYQSMLDASQRRTAAMGRVDALLTAEVPALPGIVEQLGPDRSIVRGWLHEIARGDGSGSDNRRRMPAALALLPDDETQATFLVQRALSPDAGPDEVLVIREALAAHEPPGLKEQLHRKLEERPPVLSEAQLRAAGVLARLDPDDAAWPSIVVPLAHAMVRENALRIAAWRQVFQPLAKMLLAPLREQCADSTQPEARERAFTLLVDFADDPLNPNRAEDLAALFGMADPERMDELLDLLAEPGEVSRAITVLQAQLDPPARFDAARSARQGRIATALMRLGQSDRIWPLFTQTDEPSLRTELIHDVARYDVDPGPIIARLLQEDEPSRRRALILCLGEYPKTKLEPAQREQLSTWLVSRFRQDPDAGVHGAIDWLLRRCWGWGERLDAADRELAARDPDDDRAWYVNGQGQTFTILRGPISFRMGSTRELDPESLAAENQHIREIPRSFAIAAREVSMAEYARFLDEKPAGVEDRRRDESIRSFTLAHPAGMATWYEACRYCNWLSAREGLPREQWCYPADMGPESKLPDDFLRRTGYRLATEAEWEYGCRAGTISARPLGCATHWLAKYAWLERTSASVVNPVGMLKPNDFGLFDMLSNSYEWTASVHLPYPATIAARPARDEISGAGCSPDLHRVLRGGTVLFAASTLRSAFRSSGVIPTSSYNYIGFRLARTITISSVPRSKVHPKSP